MTTMMTLEFLGADGVPLAETRIPRNIFAQVGQFHFTARMKVGGVITAYRFTPETGEAMSGDVVQDGTQSARSVGRYDLRGFGPLSLPLTGLLAEDRIIGTFVTVADTHTGRLSTTVSPVTIKRNFAGAPPNMDNAMLEFLDRHDEVLAMACIPANVLIEGDHCTIKSCPISAAVKAKGEVERYRVTTVTGKTMHGAVKQGPRPCPPFQNIPQNANENILEPFYLNRVNVTCGDRIGGLFEVRTIKTDEDRTQ
jgi:hypothetical protein